MKVAVIGAGGHVGLPFSLVCAEAGYTVIGIDKNWERVATLNDGEMPFIENGADEILKRHIGRKLNFTDDVAAISDADIVAVMIGTPVDAEGNPRLDDIIKFFDEAMPHITKDTLIILRSTVAPGTTELIKEKIEEEKIWLESREFNLVFCPERVAQGHGIEESGKFPQLIGAFTSTGYKKACDFFDEFVKGDLIWLTTKEAEIGKLMTNMYRYVNFALANEFYMIGSQYHDVDIHRVTEAINRDYPRMNLALPGPNVGGPCLFKDGKFLTENIPYTELIQTSFLINEGMPQFIVKQILDRNSLTKPRKVMILGMTFKAENDDTRNSLSFKLKKILYSKGIDVVCVDPYLDQTHIDEKDWLEIDAVVVMTPHKYFKEFYEQKIKTKCGGYTLIIDIWKHLDDSKNTAHGIFDLGDFQ